MNPSDVTRAHAWGTEMARKRGLRQPDGESPVKTGFFALARSVSPVHVAAILAILAAAFLAVYYLAGIGGGKAHAEPAYLKGALGAPQRSASLDRRPAPAIRVKIRRDGGYTTSRHGHAVT